MSDPILSRLFTDADPTGLGWMVRLWIENEGCTGRFELFQVKDFDLYDDNTLYYERKADVHGSFDTMNLDDALPLMRGSIKWDGCSNVEYSTDEVCHHLCGRADWLNFSQVLPKVFDVVTAFIPKFDAEVGR